LGKGRKECELEQGLLTPALFSSWLFIVFVFSVFISVETLAEIQQNSILLASSFFELIQGVKEVKYATHCPLFNLLLVS